jgi:hypothetical protein
MSWASDIPYSFFKLIIALKKLASCYNLHCCLDYISNTVSACITGVRTLVKYALAVSEIPARFVGTFELLLAFNA